MLAVLVALLLVAAGLGYALWPQQGRLDSAQQYIAPSAAEQVDPAAAAMRTLPGVKLAVFFYPGQGQPAAQGELTVTASGSAAGTLSEPVTGSAQVAWSAGQLYLKGDNSFWAAQSPQYADDVSSSGHWVAPQKQSGYYMLDSFGLDVASLTPSSLASAARQIASAADVATDEDSATVSGQKAVSFTSGDWTVTVTAAAPHRILAIGGPLPGSGPIQLAAWTRQTRPVATVNAADYEVSAPRQDDPDEFDNPYVVLAPQPAAASDVTSADATVAQATAAAPTPTTPDDSSGTQQQGPAFTVDDLSNYLCTSAECPLTFKVTNSGNQPGDATLYVSVPGQPDNPYPLGTLAPGESQEVTDTHANLAPAGQTVNYTVNTWVYSSTLYGPDPSVVQRLRGRNLNPGDQYQVSSIAAALQPAAVSLLDQMTKDSPTSDTQANTAALNALQSADQQGQLPLLSTIASSGRLQNPGDLPAIIAAANTIGNVRVMEQVAYLLQIDPTAKVWYDGPYDFEGQQYKADYIYTGTVNGQPVKRSVQVKDVQNLSNLGTLAGTGAKQLNGEQPGAYGRGNDGENTPPGFERVLMLYLEPTTGTRIFMDTQSELEDYLSSKSFRQARANLCKPDNGGSRVDRLIIINGTGVHQWTDLSKIGVRC